MNELSSIAPSAHQPALFLIHVGIIFIFSSFKIDLGFIWKLDVDTKKFSYADEEQFNFEVELSIKGITHTVPLKLEVLHLAEELIQIKGKLNFSRTAFEIGKGKWASTALLKDKASILFGYFLSKSLLKVINSFNLC